MHFVKKTTLFILIILGFSSLRAQDAELSQYYTAPMYLNPGMTGLAYSPRINMVYRNQWPSIGEGYNSGFVSYLVSYDQHFEAIRSGLGLLIMSDRIGGDLLVSNSIGLSYAYQLRISRGLGVKIGLQALYNNKYVDWFELRFSDQIDLLNGFNDEFGIPNPTQEMVPPTFNLNSFDMALGGIFFNENFYLGTSIKHLIRPDDSFTGSGAKVPLRFSAHGGVVTQLGSNKYSKGYFSPNVLYTHQLNFKQLNAGALFGYDFFYVGSWIRYTFSNSDAVIMVLGVKKGVFRMGYSYDVTLSKLRAASGGSHEVSVTINVGKDDNSLNPRNRSGIYSCPKILNF